MLSSEFRSLPLCALHSPFENASGVGQLQFINRWKDVCVSEEGFLVVLFDLVVLDLSVDAGFWLIVDPLSDKKLVLIMIEIRALALAHVVNPVALEVVTVSLG